MAELKRIASKEQPQPEETLTPPPLNELDELQKLAKIFANSDFIPEHYRRKPDNCFIALYSAWRMKLDPLAFMRHTYVVHGNLGIDGQMIIALANERGPFAKPIDWRFEGQGEQRKCTAFAPLKSGGEASAELTWATVKAEGWASKSGSKWLTMPQQMFCYRSAAFLVRRYCPEVLLGLPRSVDELEDIADAPEPTVLPTNLDDVADTLPANEPIAAPPVEIVDEPITKEQRKALADGAIVLGVDGLDLLPLFEKLAIASGAPSFNELKQSQLEGFRQALQQEVSPS